MKTYSQLNYVVPPRNQGQTIEIAYAITPDEVVRRTRSPNAARTSEAWWTWYYQDSSRASEDHREAEFRCCVWMSGRSDDGPSDYRDTYHTTDICNLIGKWEPQNRVPSVEGDWDEVRGCDRTPA